MNIKIGQSVKVPGRFRNLIVREVRQLRSGELLVRADFKSGFGWVEMPASAFVPEVFAEA
jgi:hypothetical protein